MRQTEQTGKIKYPASEFALCEVRKRCTIWLSKGGGWTHLRSAYLWHLLPWVAGRRNATRKGHGIEAGRTPPTWPTPRLLAPFAGTLASTLAGRFSHTPAAVGYAHVLHERRWQAGLTFLKANYQSITTSLWISPAPTCHSTGNWPSQRQYINGTKMVI